MHTTFTEPTTKVSIKADNAWTTLNKLVETSSLDDFKQFVLSQDRVQSHISPQYILERLISSPKEHPDHLRWLLSSHSHLELDVNADRGSRECFKLLHDAAQNGHVEYCRQLLQAGANVNAGSHTHAITPLEFAMLRNQRECAYLLLRKGATIKQWKYSLPLPEWATQYKPRKIF